MNTGSKRDARGEATMAKMMTGPAPVTISAGSARLKGDLVVPPGALGVVLFAHGSGSSRLSPRNRFVADALNSRGLGTLLINLLTEEEAERDERTGDLRFDIPLLARRLAAVSSWLR